LLIFAFYRDAIAIAMLERDAAKHKRNVMLKGCDAMVKNATQAAWLKERQHFSKVIATHKDKVEDLSSHVTSLTERTITA
jgi:uncharacterized protein (DUF342 family)